VEAEEDVPVADEAAPAPAPFQWGSLVVIAVAVILAIGLFAKVVLHWPGSGKYPLLGHDHDDLMVSDAPHASRTVTVMFVGNSLTFVNDLPAMVVDIASSDPGATTRLQIKGETYPDATLDKLRTQTGALAWAQSHHVDDVVLQEHSYWYEAPDDYQLAVQSAQAWVDALRPTGATPVVFGVWADGDGSQVFTDRQYPTFGSTSARDAQNAMESTRSLASRVGAEVAPVGQAFDTARQTPGAPDVWGPDRHHPSAAGTYLAALVFYRFLTGRNGAEATWRPDGLSADDAAKLQRFAGG
jgi:hypothetical protein